MIEESPQSRVFDCSDLRKYILSNLVYDTYIQEVESWVRNLVETLVYERWFLHCSCENCQNLARNYLQGV